MVRYTLCKQERLSSLKAIEALFEKGLSLAKYPVRLVWLDLTEPEQRDFPIQVLFSVSKKKFSRAVDRNRIKRLMRESYRLLKPGLYESLADGKSYHIAFIYTGTSLPDLGIIQKSISFTLERWLAQVKDIPPTVKKEGNP